MTILDFKFSVMPAVLGSVCAEYGYRWGEVLQRMEDGPSSVRIHFVDPKKHFHLSHLFVLPEILKDEYEVDFEKEVRRVLNEWKCGESKFVQYRYEVNIGGGCATGSVSVYENATDDEIRLAIMDDLYDVSYEKIEEE